MLKRKARRILAGLCVALMLTQSVGESTLTAMAAEGVTEAVAAEDALEEDETDGAVVSGGDAESTLPDGSSQPVVSGGNTEDSVTDGDGKSAVSAGDTEGTLADGEDISGNSPAASVAVVPEEAEKQVLAISERVVVGDDGSVTVDNIPFGVIDAEGVLTVSANIGNIPTGLFQGWTDVKVIRFEEGAYIKDIAGKTFQDCTSLTSIDFTNCPSLTQIGSQAFSGCTSLETVVFNDNLQRIYSKAFEKCTSLQSVALVPGLIEVREYAFSGCSGLTSVKVETSNVRCQTQSGGAAVGIFNGCNIRTIEFAIRNLEGDNSKNNIIVPANLFNKATFADDANIVIPCEIQEIGTGAFTGSNLKSVTFQNDAQAPSALSTIGASAFKDCKSLGSVTFPSTLQTLGESSFSGCIALTELVIPNSVTAMNTRAFSGCTGLVNLTLPNATTTIGDYVFEKCTSLETVEIPEGITFTGKGEFSSCTKLSSVTIAGTVETIGDETFKYCAALQTVELPDSVTSLGKSSFEAPIGGSQLRTIRYSVNLKQIKDSAFKNCTNLTSNEFPEALELIGTSAFENCQSFLNLTIPANVTSIGAKAFLGCYGIDVLTIETNKLTTCGTAIFNQCLLRQVIFPEGITVIPANLFSQATFTTDSVMVIPATVTSIGRNAFGGTKSAAVNISMIQFEEGTMLTSIGDLAFTYCTALEQFNIPETTLEIGQNAFAGCIKISSIVIPENVTKIGAGAFSGCEILSEITYNAIEVTTSNQNIFAKCNVKRILIGEKVRAFPANLFRGAQFSTNSTTGEEELISIYIPASVEKFGQYALPNIANLQNLVFEKGSRLTTIEQYAFYQCVNLTGCNLPDTVTTIGNYAFAGCTKLGSDSTKPFHIPASLVTLGSSAFSECPSLTEAVIPEGVAKIGDKAFLNDTGLTSVVLEGGDLTEIGVSAFEGCTALTEITIPNGVTRIGATAFKNCSALKKVVIPASVTYIGADAFSGCGNIEFYVVPGSYAEQWLADNGLSSTKLLTITYVLNEGLNAPENPAGYEAGDTFLFAPATRKGYVFKGWYLDENFQTEIKGVEGCTGNLTIYAKWDIEYYTITYVLNGGENHKDNPETYTILDKITLKNPTKEGFTFKGWLTDPDNSKSVVTVINPGNSGDKILYAWWNVVPTEAPTASIESGSVVKSGTKIFLSSATPGASIFYTLDGTEPTAESRQYVDGIVIDRDMTVKAMAVKKGYKESEVAVFEYSIINESLFWGDILPEDQAQYGSASEVPEGIWVAGVEDVVYTGQKITFDLRVYDHKTLLKEKTDYTVKYANNKNAGDKDAVKKAPSVTITAKGNYKGKDVVKFTIAQRDIGAEDFTAADMMTHVTGKLQKPVPVLYYGKTKLKNKRDYQVVYLGTADGGYQNAGEYEVKLEGKGNFKGEKIVKFTLVDKISVAKAKITGLTAQAYTGEAITPEFTVKMGTGTLDRGTDYDVIYSDNTDAGTAAVTIVGKGKYYGTKKATFKITPIATLKKVKFTLNRTRVDYTGQAYEIGSGIQVDADFNGKSLRKDVDYTCTYKKNTDVGTATVTFTGKGGYTGTAKKTFKIVSADISKLGISFLDSEGNVKTDSAYAFVQGGVKPAVQLTFGGKKLVAGKDYTLSYKNNTAKGTARITVKGKKNFKGTLSENFTITQQNVAELSVSATDVMYKNQAGVVGTTKVTVKDVNGKTLALGKDYKVSYTYVNDTRLADGTLKKKGNAVSLQRDVIPVETQIALKVTGMGNYKGTVQTDIRIYKRSISSAKVTVKPQIYTGSEIQPGIDQMTVKIGRDELQIGDYEIVGYSNNIKKGTAKVTIRGIGNYGGTKTVNFKITQKPFALFKFFF